VVLASPESGIEEPSTVAILLNFFDELRHLLLSIRELICPRRAKQRHASFRSSRDLDS
jgi:hypothetical protein